MSEFLRVTSRRGEPFLFGGAARDVFFRGRQEVNDLDIFVSGALSEEDFSSLGPVRRNRFGGYKLIAGGYDIDIWELERSLAFKWSATSFISVSNLLRTVCFTTDAIAISFNGYRLIKSKDFDWSCDTRTLGFVAPPMEFNALVATRIARISLKLGLDLSPAVANYFENCVERFGSHAIVDAESRWGSKRFLTEIAVEEVRAKILFSMDRAFDALRMSSVR